MFLFLLPTPHGVIMLMMCNAHSLTGLSAEISLGFFSVFDSTLH